MLNQITSTFRPSLAFKVGLSASEKRGMVRFHKFRNYRARQGRLVAYYDPFFNVEVGSLRAHIDRLVNLLANLLADTMPWE